jgi:hypothetical protein
MAVALSNLGATWITSSVSVNNSIKMSVNDVNSSANSTLLKFDVNSNTKFVVYKSGDLTVGNTAIRNPAAIIEAWSKNQGILFPRLTTTERESIQNPPDGLVIYNEETDFLQIRRAGVWVNVGDVGLPGALPSIAKTLYVATSGSDTANDGTSEYAPFATIEKAVEIATLRNELTIIKVGPGIYLTNGHIDLPDNCILQGVHRAVFIRPNPGYEVRNVFRMGSGCFIEGFIIENFRLDSLTDPTEGFAFSFRPGAVITRVPYAHKCAVRVPQPESVTGGTLNPLSDPPNPGYPTGAGVCLADGMVCSQYSIFPNIMTWGATPVSYNGIGYCAKNGGLINAVNAISMWAHKHFLAMSGGQIILSSCSTQFGDYSLVSTGSRYIPVTIPLTATMSVQTAAADLVAANRTNIINGLWQSLIDNGYINGDWVLPDDEDYTRFDSNVWIRSLEYMLRGGTFDMIERFQLVLFNAVGNLVFSSAKLNAFIYSYQYIRDQINALGINSNAQAMITDAAAKVITLITDATNSPTARRRIEPSKIEAIGHTWTANMIGVWQIKIPPAASRLPIRDSILEQNGGLVIATGQDSEGNALFAGDVTIDARFGMGGRGFIAPTKREAIRAAITFGGFG